jgi:hypothetical protein
MRSISKGALLALAMVCVLSAVAASSAAAALPEFQKEGKPLAEVVKFSSGENVSFYLEQHDGEYECEAAISGETKGSKEVTNVSIKFAECSYGGPCSKLGLEAKGLTGHLGLVGPEEVGLLLEGSKEVFATTAYGGKTACLLGSLIGRLTPTGKSTTKFELQYTHVLREVQGITHFEGESLIHHLTENTNDVEAAAEAGFSLTMSKAIELKL